MKKGIIPVVILILGTIALVYGALAVSRLSVEQAPSSERNFGETFDKILPGPDTKPSSPVSIPQSPQPNQPAPTLSPSTTSVTLNTVSPNSAKAQDLVVLKGANFGTAPGTVIFETPGSGGCCGTRPDSWSDTEIKVKVISFGTTGTKQLKVFRPDGKISNSISFERLP